MAWTLLMRSSEPYSLFVTASPAEKMLVGQVIVDNIRHTDVNIFHAQMSGKKGEVSNSSVLCQSTDVEKMVEEYYQQSEQLPLKVSLLRDSDMALALVGMPEVDLGWFEENEPEEIYTNLSDFSHKLMKQCEFSYFCNCSPEKLLPFLKKIPKVELEELYGDDPKIVVNCPRCGKNFEMSREELLPNSN